MQGTLVYPEIAVIARIARQTRNAKSVGSAQRQIIQGTLDSYRRIDQMPRENLFP